MSIISRIYTKIVFKNFKKLKKINYYYTDIGSLQKFSNLIKDRSENFNYTFSKYSYQAHNPLIGADKCIKYICEKYHAAFDYLDSKPVKSLLEIGCGFGVSTWILKDAVSGETIGLDINKEAIKTAKKLFPEVKYIQEDFKKYFKKNPSAFFDVIISSDSPFHMPKKNSELNDLNKSRKKIHETSQHLASGRKLIKGHENIILYRKLNLRTAKEILNHCNKYIQIGYRAQNIRSFLFWEHKAKGIQLSYYITLIDGKKNRISWKYLKYFFTWHYLQSIIHAIRNRFYIPL